MSRLEFMKQLARLLDDLPREEKIEILKYYNGYFDDAGEENEAAIIEELGSPERVAAEVKAGVQEDLSPHADAHDDAEENGRDSVNHGEDSYRYEEAPSGDAGHGQDRTRARHGGSNGWKTMAILAILLVTFPLWIGLLGGLLGLLGGAIGVIVAVAVGLVGALIGLVGGAVGCIVSGIAMLVTAPITGMLSLAVGIFLLGLMLLAGLLVGLFFGKIIPGIVGGIGKLVRGAGKAVGGILDGIVGRR